MIEEFVEMWVYGVRHVIPDELYNEAMDYCEWKNGYRVEAMTGAARGLILKIQNILMTSLKSFILAKIGYVQGVKIGTQSGEMVAVCSRNRDPDNNERIRHTAEILISHQQEFAGKDVRRAVRPQKACCERDNIRRSNKRSRD